MHKIYLLILLCSGALTVITVNSEELLQSESNSPVLFSSMNCTGFSASILSDTVYNCPANTHIYTIDTSANFVYQWIGPTGYISSNWEIFVTQRGIYGLTVVDTVNNCTATDSIYVRQLPCEDLSSEWIPPGIDITVYLDTIAPTFTTPADTTVFTDQLCVASTSSASIGTVIDETDDCDTNLDVTFQDSISNDCSGSITIYRTWSVEDDCGNLSTGEQTIFVRDTIGPSIAVPSDIMVYVDNVCFADTSASTTGNYLTVSDGCDASISTASYTDVRIDICAGSYDIIRTWSAIDDCGNTGTATQVISVVDSTSPQLIIPPDTTITASGIPNNASASDYCSVTPFLTYSDSISTVGCQRQVFRTWTAIDDCGNTSSGVQNIFYDQSFTANLTVSEYNGQPLSCTGSSDGELTANVAGGVSPISYVWSSGHTNATISGLDTGYYSVTITDSNGCSDSLSITLTAPNPIQITFNTNDPLCVQASNGAIDASISGGTSPYTYLWLHDSTSVEDINNLSAATYILEVTDVNGCQATDSTILQNPLPFSIDVVLTSDYNGYTTSCNGSSDASASINLTNNSGAVTYLWSNGQTSSVLSNVASGTYTITATDSNGCEAIDSISIADNPGITTSISITSDYNGSPVSCYNSSDGSAEVSATGGESPYTYLWSNGSTSNTVTSVDTGTYLVTVTDFNGCQGIDTLVIDFVNNVLVDISINSDYQGNALSCRDASDASISVEVTNGLGPYTYSWSNGSTQDSIFGLAAGVYNLTVTDANGCQTVDFITIPNPPPLQVDLTTNLLNCGIDDGQILITATGGSGMYEYSLDSTNWQLNNVFDSLPPGGHMVYVRDVSQGCSATPSVVILSTTSAPGIENLTAIHPTGPGLTDGSIMIDVVGIGLPVEYRLSGLTSWQPSNIFQGLGEGTYNTEIRYVGQTCADSASITLVASGGITTIDSTSNVCSDELSNIQNLEVYYLPVAEDHILQALQTITPVGCANIYSVDPIHNYIYIGVVESGTVVTYDHWEDGFETNFDFSIQPTTEIWGDGNPNNGMPPGYNLDILQAGDKIFLNNPVVSTTRATVLDYDAGDRISSRGSISITRLGWATGSSTLFAGAVEVHKTDAWGQNYSIPVGQNTDVNSMFVYTGFTIMAAQNNTTIQIDADNNAVLDAVITLNEGESYLYNGGVYSGGKISASSPVQIHLLTGDDCSNYESRWFTLSPEENWDNGYYVPVSTLNNGAPTTNGINKPTYVHLYNPHAYDISVVWRTDSGIQDTLNIAGEQTAYQEIPEGTGAHFGSDDNFYAIATIDSDPGNNTANDWGFALLPERLLSPQIYLTGFAPGQNPAFTCDIGIEIDPLNYTIDSISSEELISINGQIQNAFDNDLTTAWFSEYSSFTNDHPHEIVLDLGQNYNVSGFKHINALSALYVDTFLNPNPPFVLPNNTLFDTISAFAITDQHSIIDLNVHIDIDHTKINDLTLTLESPSGTRVLLVDDQCTTAMDLKTTFDNEASDLLDCANTTVGYYIPKERLSAFYGEFTAGVWQLHIEDDNGILGGGLLNSWSLEITHGVSTNGAISEFEFYVSDDGINWGVPVGHGTWIDSIPFHDERITPIDARYVRFVSLGDFDGLGIASIGELRILECGSTYTENSSPIWLTAGHAGDINDTIDITVCVDFNGDGGSIIDPTGAAYDSSFTIAPMGLIKIYDPDGDQTGIRIWVCDGSDAVISGAWGQDPENASTADPAIDLGVGLLNSIPYSAQKCVELVNDYAGNDLYDRCDEVTYTIIIKNTGALPLSTGTIAVIDTLPVELEYIPGTSRGMVDHYTIVVEDDSINTTPFPFDEGGTAIDTIILPGDSLLVKFDALIANINFATFLTNQVFVTDFNNSFEPFVSIPVQEPINPLDSLVPADTLVSCEAFIYPDPSIDTLSYLSIHDTIFGGHCLDAYTFQRIYTFTDNCYNQYVDTLLITVTDTTPPILNIPSDTIINIADLPYQPIITDSDNCDTDVTITITEDTIFNVCNYVIERIYIAEDNCSNTSQDTLRYTVVYEDQSWPVLINAADTEPCEDETVALTSVILNGNGLNYYPSWYYRADTTQGWNTISGANQVNHSFDADQQTTGYYQVRYSLDSTGAEVGCVIHSEDIIISTRPIPAGGFVNAVICNGEQFEFLGNMYSSTGTYIDNTTTASGCDSTVQLDLFVALEDLTILSDTICYNETYIFAGQNLTSSGVYYDTLSNQYGCDSILEIRLHIRPEITDTLDMAICYGEILNYNGTTYSTSGSYTEILTSSVGCDSVVTLNLLVRPPSQSTSNIDLCYGDSILIGSQYMKASGTYTDTLLNLYGCDSIATYQVQIDASPIVQNLNQIICEGDSLLFNGTYLKTTGIYQEQTTSHLSGCDSTTNLNLLVEPVPSTGYVSAVICNGVQFEFLGNMYSSTGTYIDTTTTANGCDSTVQLDLLVIMEDWTILNDTICYNEWYTFGGQTLNTSGVYFNTLSNSYGCDSIVEMRLHVRPTITNTVNLIICDGEILDYNGKTFSTSGSYNEIFASSTGCDSLVTLNLLIRPPAQGTSNINLCFGDSVLIGTQYIKTSGTYTESLFNQYGCDSAATYEVQIEALPIVQNINQVICEGDSLLFDGTYLKTTGNYQEMTTSLLSGCDSTTYLNLMVEPVIRLEANNLTICEGEIVNLNVNGADSVNWSNTQGFSCVNCPNPEVFVSETTTYTATTNSCAGQQTSVSMTINVLQKPEVSIIRDTSIVLGETVTLHAQVNIPTSITNWYTSENQLLCANCLSTSVTPRENTYYIVEASNEEGCIDRDSILVRVRDGCVEGEIVIPNYLTPNGDGQNDVFTVQWNGIKTAEKLRIFNRWGELLFSTDQVDKEFWDGTFGGEAVNPGVYVYYVEYYCLNDQLQRHKGNVTVIR